MVKFSQTLRFATSVLTTPKMLSNPQTFLDHLNNCLLGITKPSMHPSIQAIESVELSPHLKPPAVVAITSKDSTQTTNSQTGIASRRPAISSILGLAYLFSNEHVYVLHSRS